MRENDNIKELFRAKLNDFEAPVPPDGWQRVEESLAAASRLRVVRRRWIASAAAAVAALIIGGLLFVNHPGSTDTPVFTETVPQQKTNPVQSQIEKEETSSTTPSILKKAERLVSKIVEPVQPKHELAKQPVLVASASNKTEGKKQAEPDKLVNAEEKLSIDENIIKNNPTDDYFPEITDEERERLIREFVDQANGNESYLNLGRSGDNDRPLTLAFNARGGLNSSQRMVNSPMTLRSAKVTEEKPNDASRQMYTMSALNAVENVPNETGADNISEMIHSQPVSVGFTVSKSITDQISVETGLVYTYLYSKALNTSTEFKSKETQQFHYMGIPLNVNYNVLSLKKMDMYVSLGGMIEKDVYGKYEYVDKTVQQELNSSKENLVSRKIRQMNPQLSVNAGLGASYPLYDKLKIYGKIGGAYYFDAKNDYKTFYSDKKIVLDLNVGLKIDF